MASIETALKWFTDRKGKVTYSMESRNGPNSYDCSSSVYHALIAGGFLPSSQWIGNTDSEYGSLESHGWVQLQPNKQGNFDTQRGDVFIWGDRGASAGAFGHTGMFLDADNIIDCNYAYNGIHVENYDWFHNIQKPVPNQTFYRYTGNSTPAPASNDPNDQQIVAGASYIKFLDTFHVDDLQLIGGIWQVKTNVLCRAGFTWDDNGIPAEPLVEVDSNGYATNDQNLGVGSLYKLPGKYLVLDLGYTDGMWLAQIEASGVKFWVDVATATEVPSSDDGTPTPSKAPAPVPVPPTPTPAPEPAPVPPVNPVDPSIPTVPVNDPTVPKPEPKPEPVPAPAPVEESFLSKLLKAILAWAIRFFGNKK